MTLLPLAGGRPTRAASSSRLSPVPTRSSIRAAFGTPDLLQRRVELPARIRHVHWAEHSRNFCLQRPGRDGEQRQLRHEARGKRWSPTMINNMCWATRGPYGFPMFADNAIKSTRYSWMFDKCGVVGANPPYAKGKFGNSTECHGNPYCGTGPFEGDECTLIDCATSQNSFGGIVTSGGSNHKVRYDGTNWVRVG